MYGGAGDIKVFLRGTIHDLPSFFKCIIVAAYYFAVVNYEYIIMHCSYCADFHIQAD